MDEARERRRRRRGEAERDGDGASDRRRRRRDGDDDAGENGDEEHRPRRRRERTIDGDEPRSKGGRRRDGDASLRDEEKDDEGRRSPPAPAASEGRNTAPVPDNDPFSLDDVDGPSLSFTISSGEATLESLAGTEEFADDGDGTGAPSASATKEEIARYRDKIRKIKGDLSSIPSTFMVKPATFDPVSVVSDVVNRKKQSERERKLEELLTRFRVADSSINELVGDHYAAFNSSIRYFSDVVDHMASSKDNVSVLRSQMLQTKTILSGQHDDLRDLWLQSIQVTDALGLLDRISSVVGVPEEVESGLRNRQYLYAVKRMKKTIRLLDNEDMMAIRAIRDIRDELKDRYDNLHELIIDELQGLVFRQKSVVEPLWPGETVEMIVGSLGPQGGLPVALDFSPTSMAMDAHYSYRLDDPGDPHCCAFMGMLLEALDQLGKLSVAQSSLVKGLRVELKNVIRSVMLEAMRLSDDDDGSLPSSPAEVPDGALPDMLDCCFTDKRLRRFVTMMCSRMASVLSRACLLVRMFDMKSAAAVRSAANNGSDRKDERPGSGSGILGISGSSSSSGSGLSTLATSRSSGSGLSTAATSRSSGNGHMKNVKLSKPDFDAVRIAILQKIQSLRAERSLSANHGSFVRSLQSFVSGFLDKLPARSFYFDDIVAVFATTMRSEFAAASHGSTYSPGTAGGAIGSGTDAADAASVVDAYVREFQGVVADVLNPHVASVALTSTGVWQAMQLEVEDHFLDLLDASNGSSADGLSLLGIHGDASQLFDVGAADKTGGSSGHFTEDHSRLRFSFSSMSSSGSDAAVSSPPSSLAHGVTGGSGGGGGARSGSATLLSHAGAGAGTLAPSPDDAPRISLQEFEEWVAPSVYNIVPVYDIVLWFIETGSRILAHFAGNTGTERSILSSFIDQFLASCLMPRIKSDCKYRLDKVLIRSADAFRPRDSKILMDGSTAAAAADCAAGVASGGFVLPGVLRTWKLIYGQLWPIARRLPVYLQEMCRIIEFCTETLLREAWKRFTSSAGDTFGGELSADESVCLALRRDPFYSRAFLPRDAVVAGPGDVSELEDEIRSFSRSLAQNIDFSLSRISGFPRNKLLLDVSKVTLMATLCSSMRWLSEQFRLWGTPRAMHRFGAGGTYFGGYGAMSPSGTAHGFHSGDGAGGNVLTGRSSVSAVLSTGGSRGRSESTGSGSGSGNGSSVARAAHRKGGAPSAAGGRGGAVFGSSLPGLHGRNGGKGTARQILPSTPLTFELLAALLSVSSPSATPLSSSSSSSATAFSASPRGWPSSAGPGSTSPSMAAIGANAAATAPSMSASIPPMLQSAVLRATMSLTAVDSVGHFIERFPKLRRLADELAALADRTLFTMRIDIRARVFFFIAEGMIRASTLYVVQEEAPEPDGFIVNFNRDLARADENLSLYLPPGPAGVQFIFGGLGELICSVLIRGLSTMRLPRSFNALGVQKMARNIFALQQNLTAIVGADIAKGLHSQNPFDRARRYFELLMIADERDLFSAISEQGPEFSLDEYKALLLTEVPHRRTTSSSALSTLESIFHQFDASAGGSTTTSSGRRK